MSDWLSPLWITIDDATGRPPGVHHFRITDGGVYRRCGTCNATFPQTDDGWNDLQQHEFELHERPVHYEWSELEGLTVRLQLVRRREAPGYFGPKEGHVRVELVALAEDGTVYTFPFDGHEERDDYHGGGKTGYFKVKPRAMVGRLLGTGTR